MKRKNRDVCIRRTVGDRVCKIMVAVGCLMVMEGLHTATFGPEASLFSSQAQADGWWNFGKKSTSTSASPGVSSTPAASTNANLYGTAAPESGATSTTLAATHPQTGSNYAAAEPENPAKSKGFTFSFPWSKKKEEQPVVDPFGKAEHPLSEEYQARNYGTQGMSSPAGNSLPGDLSGDYPATITPVADDYAATPAKINGYHNGAAYDAPYSGENMPGMVAPPAASHPGAVNQYTPDFQASVPENGMDYPANHRHDATLGHMPMPAPMVGESSPQIGGAISPEARRTAESNATMEFRFPQTAIPSSGPATTPSEPNLAAMRTDSRGMAGSEFQVFEQGKPLAWVGTEVILAADVYGEIDAMLAEHQDNITVSEYKQKREEYARQLLERRIDEKLVYCDMLRNVPGDMLKKYQEMINRMFDTKELPSRIQKANVESREAYEALLQKYGQSISKQRSQYREDFLRQQWVSQNIQQDYQVSHAEMMDYYHEHTKDFEVPARACWEELVVRKNRFRNREEAYQELARMGTLVATRKMNFDQVAREFSHGVTASDGGRNSWIRPGELASKELDAAIFTQPPGKLSHSIIEDSDHFYIIRVTQRDEQHITPFVDVQDKIRDSIREQKFQESVMKYLAKIKKEIPVTTIFDGLPTLEELHAQRRSEESRMGMEF